ncbi:transcription factor mef2A [Rhagoletis pomonella]|uniref:transcription factor mef2A n=1 Tax=Rhagoletis pomonella TaxID=28610 RepID=UPI001784AFB8|nr:transcription factor mef2A [Rhagoletis pomonella]XP_036333973.1 transcription factor mef2A [Rhagoletis pomonella]
MAAKPPKPPATFLKQNSHGNNNDSNANQVHNNHNNSDPSTSTDLASPKHTTPTSATTGTPLAETFSKLGIRRYNSRDNLLNNISNDNNNSDSGIDAAGNNSEGAASARPACNCTNISIMHLFHEMKQEFPTIPDPIVAQCVNENCHQRENCIQMLRNELALNPTPAQTYPAKVLQQHNINQQHNSAHQSKPSFQQQQQQQRQFSPQAQTSPQSPHPQPPQRHKNAVSQKPATPLRPIRAAPTQPPPGTLPRKRSDVKTNCDSVELVQTNNSNNNNCNNSGHLLKDVSSDHLPCNNHSSSNNNSVGELTSQTCDMPAAASATTNTPGECARSSDFVAALNKLGATPPPPALAPLIATRPRARPNTLNLQASQQQLQRQQLNKQLQQHLQQRCQLQQQQQQPSTGLSADTSQQKPIRKAPLPPIAPKPVFHNQTNNSHNLINNNNNNSCGNSPQSQSGGSYSTESNLTSPISSCGESEFAVNVGLTSQAFALGHNNNNRHNNNNSHIASTAPAYQQQPSSPLKSPIRHRSVITVQPEPPYARDFLPPSNISTSAVSTSSAGGSASSTPTSQKSYTSVNLTLRQPTAVAPQSTIDISAGPALSGNGSGLTYSSTSFDARRGFQQNFHITVTDQGGVFNASRIRPRNSSNYAGVEQQDGPGGPTGGISPTAVATHHQQPPTTTLTSPTSQPAHMLAVRGSQPATTTTTTSPTSDDMCLPYENSAFTENIKRQKTRRDKLATALRENKKKLGHVEEEINILIENLNPGESERLDHEIERLRTDCQLMLNQIENIRRYGQLTEAERLQLQQQQQQQPFPRQRPARPPPVLYPYPYQQAERDFLSPQNTPGCGTGSCIGAGSTHASAASTPNSSHLLQTSSPNVAYQQQRPDYVSHLPSYVQQPSTDEEDYSDSNTDGGDDEEPLERWPCSMCTFLNHPQLNICEACECVRILPGTVRIVPTANAASVAVVAAATPPSSRAAFIGNTSATAAAAAAALAAAAPAAIAHGSDGAGASASATTAAARTVAAE